MSLTEFHTALTNFMTATFDGDDYSCRRYEINSNVRVKLLIKCQVPLYITSHIREANQAHQCNYKGWRNAWLISGNLRAIWHLTNVSQSSSSSGVECRQPSVYRILISGDWLKFRVPFAHVRTSKRPLLSGKCYKNPHCKFLQLHS